MSGRVATLPFEHLPNLPRAVIPTVELEVEPVNWDAVRLGVDDIGEGVAARQELHCGPTHSDGGERARGGQRSCACLGRAHAG